MMRQTYWFRFTSPRGNGWQGVRHYIDAASGNVDLAFEKIVAMFKAKDLLEKKFGRDFELDDNKVVVY